MPLVGLNEGHPIRDKCQLPQTDRHYALRRAHRVAIQNWTLSVINWRRLSTELSFICDGRRAGGEFFNVENLEQNYRVEGVLLF